MSPDHAASATIGIQTAAASSCFLTNVPYRLIEDVIRKLEFEKSERWAPVIERLRGVL